MLTVEPLELDDREPLTAELTDFVESARTGRPPAVPGEAGLRAVELAERIIAAIASSPATRPAD